MEENLKQLLLKDLCARLPYGVRVKQLEPIKELELYLTSIYKDTVQVETMTGGIMACSIEAIKPYLRPMSSMTEEEKKEFQACHCVYDLHPDFQPMMCNIANEQNMFDWLNKKGFDYRGLIPMGLALEAPKDMYKTE